MTADEKRREEVVERFIAGDEVPGLALKVRLREHEVERIIRAELQRLRAIEAKAREIAETYRAHYGERARMWTAEQILAAGSGT